MPQIIDFDVGDVCWIATGQSKLVKGTVVLKFHLEDWPAVPFHYVVEIPSHIENLLEVRCGMTMSDCPREPIGFWRKGNALE